MFLDLRKNICCLEVASNCLPLWAQIWHTGPYASKTIVYITLGAVRSGLGNPGGVLPFATHTLFFCLRGCSESLIQVSSRYIFQIIASHHNSHSFWQFSIGSSIEPWLRNVGPNVNKPLTYRDALSE